MIGFRERTNHRPSFMKTNYENERKLVFKIGMFLFKKEWDFKVSEKYQTEERLKLIDCRYGHTLKRS